MLSQKTDNVDVATLCLSRWRVGDLRRRRTHQRRGEHRDKSKHTQGRSAEMDSALMW